MRFTMEIDTDNAAFDDPYELPECLRRVTDDIEHGADSGKVMDSNGNSVGTWQVQS